MQLHTPAAPDRSHQVWYVALGVYHRVGCAQACETMVQMRESGVLRGVSIGMNSNNEDHQVPIVPVDGVLLYDLHPTLPLSTMKSVWVYVNSSAAESHFKGSARFKRESTPEEREEGGGVRPGRTLTAAYACLCLSVVRCCSAGRASRDHSLASDCASWHVRLCDARWRTFTKPHPLPPLCVVCRRQRWPT